MAITRKTIFTFGRSVSIPEPFLALDDLSAFCLFFVRHIKVTRGGEHRQDTEEGSSKACIKTWSIFIISTTRSSPRGPEVDLGIPD